MISGPDFLEKQIIFAFPSKGDKLSFSNDNIVIKDGEGKVKYQSTCYRLFALFIVGSTTITTGLIERSKKFGFSIVLMSQSLKVYEIFVYKMSGNTLLRKLQYSYDDLGIGKHIIENKVINQRHVIMKQRNKIDIEYRTIELLDLYIEQLQVNKLELPTIMGIEGASARIYFSTFFAEVGWNSRKPRVKQDMVNYLLDIGYTLLFNIIEAILNIYGFDLYVGVLHRQFYMRKSLVCDLVEPFRPIIDLQVKKSIKLNQFKEDDFIIFNNQYKLKWEANSKYVGVLMDAILDKKMDIFYYIQAYYRAFMKSKKVIDFPRFLMEDRNGNN